MADENKGTTVGWTKRDELAALFMQGMLAGNAALEAGSSTGSLQSQNAAQQVAIRAYRFPSSLSPPHLPPRPVTRR
jgi:hypothetical protein